jgi:Na+/H+ antiporter NhaD/arsenite permease-like protein
MVAGFFVGVDVAGISTGFGILFMCTRTIISSRAKAKRQDASLVDKDSEKFLMGVDWPLLVLFTGLFIMISCCVQTGYPDDFFRSTFAACKTDPTHDCTALFAFMIVLFSNVISNVPLILLIKGYISNTMQAGIISRNNWMFISWVCTLAGNFILLGSAANLIVADQARKMGQDILTTINHGIFGIPSTFVITCAGIPILLKTMI